MSGPSYDATVVVVHYEQPRELARTLHALSRQTVPSDRLEVVVVDDGSAVAPDVPAGVRLVRRPDLGFTAAAARNQGASAGSAPVVLFLDADTTPEPGYVEAMLAALAGGPEVVAVGRRRHADLSGVPLSEPVETAAVGRELPEPAWLAEGYRATDDLARADADSYRYVISAVLGCSRRLFEHVGGFDEGFDAYGGEDWEWAWRAWQQGASFAHVPAAVAWHDGPDWSGRDPDGDLKAAETLRLARRVAAPTSSLCGLLLGPSELLVTAAPSLSATELVIAVDGVLRSVPTARVALTPTQRSLLAPDPRVVPRAAHHDAPAAPELRDHAVRLDLRAGVLAQADAWPAVLAATRPGDASATLVLSDAAGEVARLDVLRQHRRAALWQREPACAVQVVDMGGTGLRRVGPTDSLEAYVGGWLKP